MGEALVGAMVAAMRRANRDWAEGPRADQPKTAPRSEGAAAPARAAEECGRRTERYVAATDSSGAAWGYLVHPALMPTIYSPGGDASGDAPGEEVAARKV